MTFQFEILIAKLFVSKQLINPRHSRIVMFAQQLLKLIKVFNYKRYYLNPKFYRQLFFDIITEDFKLSLQPLLP